MGRGHWSGFSTHRSHGHRHHGVQGSRLWDLQPQAPPGGLVVLQANPVRRVETAGLPGAQSEGAGPSAGGRGGGNRRANQKGRRRGLANGHQSPARSRKGGAGRGRRLGCTWRGWR